MDKHPIETWDQLVHTMLHPAMLLQTAPADMEGYLATAKALKEALRTQLLHDTLYNKTETERALLVERYQTITGNLLNLLFHYQHYESITRGLKQFYEAVGAELEAVIILLQNTYSRYFNTDLNLPLPLRLRATRELKRTWKNITGLPNYATSNITMLDQCLLELIYHHEETAMSYHQAAYLQNLLKAIFNYLSNRESTPAYASLAELLISWNFNEFAFIQEVCLGIRKEVENQESAECRLEFLKNKQKQVSQLLERSHAAFHPAEPATKQTILEWIAQELTSLAATPKYTEKTADKEAIKIHTSISVPALALIARLFKESGIVTNTNQSEVLKFFATHFTTLRTSEFSYGHLQSKYYDANEHTKRKVHDYLMAMATLCRQL